MKNILSKVLAFALSLSCVFSVACDGGEPEHVHVFDKTVVTEEFLKSAGNCQTQAEYYYSCECGEVGSKTFLHDKTGHDFSAERHEEKYMKFPATCQSGAVYYKSCQTCGLSHNFHTFTWGERGECVFNEEVASLEYLYSAATREDSAVYYKSCICGKKGTETFSYGEPLKSYTEEEKIPYTPTSLTVTLYDSKNSVYGFTWNTEKAPLYPIVQIQKGNNLTNDCQEVLATVTKGSSYDENNKAITYYIVKAEVQLESLETYTYRAYDKYVDIGTAATTVQTKDVNSTSFTFAHVSDSQTTEGTGYGGTYFAKTLSKIVGNNDFIVHTGDIVENSKYEYEWTAMLHDNFNYLSQIPIMAISGNHETTYKNGSNETFKHFNYKLPAQASTEQGLFYSFIYGNTKFIMLNTNDLTGNKLKDEQYNWLTNELKNNTCTWTVVSLHNPLYSVGKYGADSSRNAIALALRSQLRGIFAQYGVDIVLQGHDHAISRTYPINASGVPQTERWETINGVEYSIDPNGVIYVMNGPAGNQSRAPYEIDSSLYHYAGASKACSWAEFTISGNKLTVSVKYTDGTNVNVYHTWGISKTAV